MSMDIFKDVDDKCIERMSHYGTPPTIPQWNGWREMTEDNHYCLMFKHAEERLLPVPPEATGLYYYIEMDPNQVHLWKHMAAHGPSTPPRAKSAPHKSVTNITIGDVAMTLELGEGQEGNAGHEP
ncbi:hypothetical protein C0995_000452 [Termitomyces sp. Mi166|nr:hypothetical protein C0995_000452 [Termitomyces sp. Mi166\